MTTPAPNFLTQDPGWDYGSILPLASRDSPQGPEFKLAIPGMLRNILLGVQDIAQGQTTQASSDAPVTLTPNALTALMSLPAVGSGPANSLGMFMGRTAKNADLGALTEAQLYEGRGFSPQQILKNTGWFRGADQNWRWEVSDQNAGLGPETMIVQPGVDPMGTQIPRGEIIASPFALNPNTTSSSQVRGPQIQKLFEMANGRPLQLDDVLDHPTLFQNYPQLANIKVKIDPLLKGTGSWNPNTAVLSIKDNLSPEDFMNTVLHETQHVIQRNEGFAIGGNPSQFKGLSPQDQRAAYDHLAGETEARAVESRGDLGPEDLRENPPWLYGYDVSPQNQLIKFGPPR